MKFLALSLCASIGLSAAGSPAPFPSPAPADPPAPGPFHHAPAPEDSYSSGGWFPSPSPKSSDIPEACLTAFESACSGLTAKQCSQCVIENGPFTICFVFSLVSTCRQLAAALRDFL